MRTIESELNLTAQEREDALARWMLLGKPETVLFLDIETTGFSRLYDSVYLVGMVCYEKGCFVAKQFLAGGLSEEAELLQRALAEIRRFPICVTYNGEMFDLPFLEERAKRLRVWSTEDAQFAAQRHSVDLLRLYRRHQAFFGWSNMKLKTVERFLGASREDPFDGGQLIEVFYEYARTEDERLAMVLLLHNYEDVCNLPHLLLVQQFMQMLKNGRIEQITYEQGRLQIAWDRPFVLSHCAEIALNAKKKKDASYPRARFSFEAGSVVCVIDLPSCEEPVYYYLPNAKDYYFIPAQGEIVHKTLAYDVPAGERRKAKPAECVLRGQGSFVQALPAPAGLRTYRKAYKGAEVYVEMTELQEWLKTAEPEAAQAWGRQFFELL